ncbi:hypothetical protein BCR32DRAFT_149107 [Anaeromyces robustus]|uniref:Uncharacterized protein n=1 Tax=Anaeromyces robustus TaxID=1754192 RepID=A0A1Y1XCP6_9FUNG|nr:hypothetical protein BCR32DRAFT_149107 [Anaeromyces robustus]|eukprot:ORX83495.1 hypothetical protein BCR32DRAFT_149107 [Anaeromyces robustus]
MKLSVITGLFLFLSSVLADKEKNEIKNIETCENEMELYGECIAAFNTGGEEGNESNSTESLENSCKLYYDDKCKALVNDSTNSTSVCLSNAEENFSYGITGMLIVGLKMSYLMACYKDTKENLCPLSDYIVKHITDDTLQTNNLPKELLTALANDCRDSNCNKRFVALEEFFTTLGSNSANTGRTESSTNTESTDSDKTNVLVNELLSNYLQNYKDGKCGAIDGSSDSKETDGSSDSKDAAFTLNRITYSFVTIIILSILLLI